MKIGTLVTVAQINGHPVVINPSLICSFTLGLGSDGTRFGLLRMADGNQWQLTEDSYLELLSKFDIQDVSPGTEKK